MTPAPPRSPKAREFRLGRDSAFLVGDLLPLLDFIGVLLAAWLGTLLYASFKVPDTAVTALVLEGGGRAALAAAVLAPFILCDRAFAAFASGRRTAALLRCYAVRFLMFVGAVAAIGLVSGAFAPLPRAWLVSWFAATLIVTAFTRLALATLLRYLDELGLLVETVAVVGGGPRSEHLVAALKRARGHGVDILGVFDDRAGGAGEPAPDGSIADLLELGKSRPLDWILLASPEPADELGRQRLKALVHRLKALSAPIACPRAGAPLPGAVAMTGAAPAGALASLVPPWISALLGAPLRALRSSALALRAAAGPAATLRRPVAHLRCTVDDCDVERFTGLAARFGTDRYGYAVTPNADHLIRLHDDAGFRDFYADADYVLQDSRFVARLMRRSRGVQLPVCPGSDLTVALFDGVVQPADRLVLIGGSAARAAQFAARRGLKRLAHYNPPMGFANDPAGVDACLRFIEENSPFRFCLLAVGSPQQEMLAQRLKRRGIARGLALCVGNSVAYLTGHQVRAPQWMRQRGLEWLFRLARSPRRLAARYLWRGPRVFRLLQRTDFVLREPAVPALPVAAPVSAPAAGDAARSAAARRRAARPVEHERRV